MNLVEWVISIAVMLMVIGLAFSLVGSSGRHSILAATMWKARHGTKIYEQWWARPNERSPV